MIVGVSAESLALELGLPFADTAEAAKVKGCRFMLTPGSRGLELRSLGALKENSIQIDFTAGAARHRRLYGGNSASLLARAVGVKGRTGLIVLDAAAGFGRDGFVLASLGCRVVMFERSPVIWALLRDGLRRALEHPDTAAVAARIELHRGDALDFIRNLPKEAHDRPQVIYFDPMFPDHRGAALVKKELRICREIVGDDADSGRLLEAALSAGCPRVVVKRMRRDERLGDLKPHQSLSGKTNRFDLYFKVGGAAL